jgi:hypothetical protein
MSRFSAIEGLDRIANNLRPSASLPAPLSSLRIYPTDANLLVLYSRDSVGLISPHPQPRRLGVILPSRRRMRKRQLTLHLYVPHKRPVAPSRVVAATDIAASAVVHVGVTCRRTCHFLWGPAMVVFRPLIVYLHPLGTGTTHPHPLIGRAKEEEVMMMMLWWRTEIAALFRLFASPLSNPHQYFLFCVREDARWTCTCGVESRV